ncbi:M23 family metallopeptidase [Novosphingobium sp.]|uniref:M23 family metallopeptidase n=1 Tax=Novosphingobium sp. TaxID=1874826 RepID=UPI00286A0940|nr:M23 family metallopeptidase [Novosphingobium sp.]
MFKPRDVPQFGQGGPAFGAATLTRAQEYREAPPVPAGAAPPPQGRLAQLRTTAARITEQDWTCDLAEDIGSVRWFRGLGVLLALGFAALVQWPDAKAMAALPAMPVDAGAREEFRVQMIQPLALGADSGRRMAATAALAPAQGVAERASVTFTATLTQGDSFERMLARAGVSPGDAANVVALVAGIVPPQQIAPGTQVDLVLASQDSGPRLLQHLDFRARFDLDLSVSRIGGQLQLQSRPIAIDTTPLRIRGTVGSGIYLSARAAGAPIEAIQQYLQVLDQHMSLDTGIEAGDTFDIVVNFRRAASGETQVGELLFAGLEHDGLPKAQLLRWGKDGQFFEASGMGQQRTGLIMPVVGGRVTSGFGMRRHPVLGYSRLHAGIDFGAAYGSPIYAVSDGRVSFSGWHGGHGNYVRLEHGGGFGTGYGHMSRIAVASGTPVRAGQVIGYVGSTGLSTGPHLHYELYRNGTPVNPMTVSFTVVNQVDPAELSAYKSRLAQIKTITSGAALTSLAPRQAAIGRPEARREIDRLGS